MDNNSCWNIIIKFGVGCRLASCSNDNLTCTRLRNGMHKIIDNISLQVRSHFYSEWVSYSFTRKAMHLWMAAVKGL